MFRAFLSGLSLLLPALIPSWRFFKAVQPSPRVEWRLCPSPNNAVQNWQEYRPRPMRLGPKQMAARMFWNARWNETLFMVSLSERLMGAESDHSLHELTARLRRDILEKAQPTKDTHLQFRLIFVERDGEVLERHVTYQSDLIRLRPHEL